MSFQQSDIRQEYLDFIGQKEFPCVGAKAALSKNQVQVFIADHLACPHNDRDIVNFIYDFVDASREQNELYITAAVIFRSPDTLSEEAFDQLFWTRLQALSDIDAEKFPYDHRVARDPKLADFSFSLKEEAFYVIGLNPDSSRKSRQFRYPSMVFNPHVQFDRLKDINKYEPMKHAIRNRDVLFSGSVNPMLADLVSHPKHFNTQEFNMTNNGNVHSLPNTAAMTVIPPRSGVAFKLLKGQRLMVTDIQGEQVSDFVCYNDHDRKEYLSSGRTIDYADTIFLTTGHPFYSNRSNVMFKMIDDTVGRHDFLLTPCSSDTFRIIYGHNKPHRGCFGNLVEALSPYGIQPDDIPICFNIFMHVAVDGSTGRVDVLPPKSKPGDYVILEAEMDLLVGMTACSAEKSNNFAFKPIGYRILE